MNQRIRAKFLLNKLNFNCHSESSECGLRNLWTSKLDEPTRFLASRPSGLEMLVVPARNDIYILPNSKHMIKVIGS